MSGGKKDGGDLVFNEDFDKESDITFQPPAPPVVQQTTAPPPAPPPAEPSTPIPIPEVTEANVVPAVTPKMEGASRLEPGEEVVLDFTESTAAPVTTGTIQPTDATTPVPQTDETDGQQAERRSIWSLKMFHQYFNVNDKDVMARLLSAMKGPFKRDFVEDCRENPDLYGPFWIATTLIFITVVSSNAGEYTDHKQSDKSDEDWDGDYKMIGKAALLYYIHLFGVGALLHLTLRGYGSQMSLTHSWCVYGYGLAPFLPVLIIVIFLQLIKNDKLSDALTAVTLFAGTLLSAAFLLINFYEELKVFGKHTRAVLIGLFVIQAVVGCLLVFYFHKSV